MAEHGVSSAKVRILIEQWRADAGGTYQSWFLWPERIKNFRSIRRGLEAVVAEIEAGTFGNQYKQSSLETVVGSIAEQRQIFKGPIMPFCGSQSFASRTSMKIGITSLPLGGSLIIVPAALMRKH